MIELLSNKTTLENRDLLIFDQDHFIFDTNPPKDKIFSIFSQGNPFNFLKHLDVNATPLLKSIYHCPFIEGNKYYGILPIGIRTEDSSQYRKGKFANPIFNYHFDTKFSSDVYITFLLESNNPMVRAYLGHGYTIGTLPSDGDIKEIAASIKLSNDDLLIVKTFEWYNK